MANNQKTNPSLKYSEQKFWANESAVQEESQFEKIATPKIKVEIMITVSREELVATVAKFAEQTQDMTLPEVHKNIIAREVFCMAPVRHKVDHKPNRTFCGRFISEKEVFIDITI